MRHSLNRPVRFAQKFSREQRSPAQKPERRKVKLPKVLTGREVQTPTNAHPPQLAIFGRAADPLQ